MSLLSIHSDLKSVINYYTKYVTFILKTAEWITFSGIKIESMFLNNFMQTNLLVGYHELVSY